MTFSVIMQKISFKRISMVLMAVISAILLFAGCGSKEPEVQYTEIITPGKTQAVNEVSPGEYSVGDVIISELMYKNKASYITGYGSFSDWLELYNSTSSTIDLDGWSLSDGKLEDAWYFEDCELSPGEYLLIIADGTGICDSAIHTDFALSENETLTLFSPDGMIIDSLICSGASGDESLCADLEGNVTVTGFISPGYPNTEEGFIAYSDSLTCSSPLRINEIMPANKTLFKHNGGVYYDWVELINSSDEPIELSDYYLTDDSDEPMKYRLPEKTLYPGKTLILFCTDDEVTHPNSDRSYATFAISAFGEQLYLYDSSETLIDYVFVHDTPVDGSMGRIEGLPGWYYFTEPTPDYKNYTDGCRLISSKPESSVEPGVYDDCSGFYVNLTGEGTIYYTLNGSAPGIYSAVYSSPIYIDSTTVIRAFSSEDGKIPSRISTFSFIVNENHTLPVLSICTDDITSFRSMWSQKLKGVDISGNISFFDENGSFVKDCGVCMKGWTGLDAPKKSLGVSFGGAYGDDDLDYDIFGTGHTVFSGLSVRAGQDYPITVFRNELCQQLCYEMSDSVVTQRSRYCILYLNGSCFGIYCLKDEITCQFFSSVKGVSRESVSKLRSPTTVHTSLYDEVFHELIYGSLTLQEQLDLINANFDIDSLVDWFILEGFVSNADINGNIKYFKSTELSGKWQPVFYDLDWSFNYESSTFYLIADSKYNIQISYVYQALIQSDEFIDALLMRYAEVSQTVLSNEHVLELIDEYEALLEPEIELDRYLWGENDINFWHSKVNELRDFITSNDYAKRCGMNLCEAIGVSEETRMAYLGY